MDRAEGTALPGDAASPGRRGRQPDERMRRLEERERQVAEREREADEREREADNREERLEERGARLRQQAAELRAHGRNVRERAVQAVEGANTALDASQDRMRRAEAALGRAYARAARERASTARSMKRGEHQPPLPQREFTGLADHVSELRERTAAAAARLAVTEEQVARVYDELAARDPGNREYERRANEAREAMRRARETARKYSSS